MSLLPAIVFFGLFGCDTSHSSIVVVESYSHGKLLTADSLFVIKESRGDKTSLSYLSRNLDTIYQVVFNPRNEVSFYFMKDQCDVVDSKTFNIKGRQVTVLKYRYDEVNELDEELDFYLTSGGDILAYKELAWDGYGLFLKEENQSILETLTGETSTFFNRNFNTSAY